MSLAKVSCRLLNPRCAAGLLALAVLAGPVVGLSSQDNTQ